MEKLILAILHSKRFNSKELALNVMPEQNVLHLAGYVEFAIRSPSENTEGRFSGHESNAIKDALGALEENQHMTILVNQNPCGKAGKYTLYRFQATEFFSDPKKLEKQVEGLKKAGAILNHTYTVTDKR